MEGYNKLLTPYTPSYNPYNSTFPYSLPIHTPIVCAGRDLQYWTAGKILPVDHNEIRLPYWQDSSKDDYTKRGGGRETGIVGIVF